MSGAPHKPAVAATGQEAVAEQAVAQQAAAQSVATQRIANAEAKQAAQPVTQSPVGAKVGTARADASQPIPYRSEAKGLGASAGGALFAAVLLLAVFVVALRLARKRGLLDRWIVAAPARAAGKPDLQVEHALRISPKTTLYRIRDDGRHYLLVESLVQTTLTTIPDDDIATRNHDAHHDAR